MNWTQNVIDRTILTTPGEPEFHQALTEVYASLTKVVDNNQKYKDAALLERLAVPERVIMFRIPWQDDKNRVRVNTGYRVQYSSAIGPYKGGMRFHPSVNLSILKFLGFEQTFKKRVNRATYRWWQGWCRL
jgi:glutamate dehydrogenase (NADP+)